MPAAVVVGAGIGGLAVAGALAQRDWSVTLLESGVRLRGDTAAMFLWPSGVDALRRLGLGAGLDGIATPVTDRGIRRPDGSWLVRPEEASPIGGVPVVVHREDLHDALVAGLGNRIDIRLGATVRSIRLLGDQPPAALDGTNTFEADLVVGADGVDSLVRRRLAHESAVVSAGCTAWRAVIPWYRASGMVEQLDRLPLGAEGGQTAGAGHRFRYALLGHRGSAGASSRGGIYWTATVPGAARPESPVSQLALLRRWFADWHAPIGDLIASTDPDDLIQHAVSELWPVPRAFAYHAGGGGYALLGDAAHAMAHHFAGGACLALEDAAALADAVGSATAGPSLRDALDTYSRTRRPEIVRIGRQSRRIGAALATTKANARTRDAVQGIAPGPLGRASAAVRRFRRS